LYFQQRNYFLSFILFQIKMCIAACRSAVRLVATRPCQLQLCTLWGNWLASTLVTTVHRLAHDQAFFQILSIVSFILPLDGMYCESLTSSWSERRCVTAIHTTDVTVMGQSKRCLGNVQDDRGSNLARIFWGGGRHHVQSGTGISSASYRQNAPGASSWLLFPVY
jgi:hypothetical protein